MVRQLFLCATAIAICLLLAQVAGAQVVLKSDHPQRLAGPETIESMVGESFVYDIAFLWFDRLAEGQLQLSRGEREGTYRAALHARTLGVAAFVTRDRMNSYEALMEQMPDGMLRTLVYESRLSKGRGSDRRRRTNRYEFDYAANLVRHVRLKQGEPHKNEDLAMPEGDFLNDILTAFFNFRAGNFGPVEPGRHFEIPTFNRKGPSSIVVDVLNGAHRPHADFFPPGGMLCRVKIDDEVFDTGGGDIYVWLDDFARPQRGIVENVIGLGNVRGRLRRTDATNEMDPGRSEP